jgi:hypothetical protein
MQHIDEARLAAIDALKGYLQEQPSIARILLIEDLFGMLRLVVWCDPALWEVVSAQIDATLRQSASAGLYWSGELWNAASGSAGDQGVFERAWGEGQAIEGSDRLRISDRYRNRGAWFTRIAKPLWSVNGDGGGCPIVVFYSFKGGVGRSTALASFAIQKARAGQRVVVADFDLDAPGVGSLLAADPTGTTATWGVVDYLLERVRGEVELSDYYHACRRDAVTGAGEILVVPAGRIDTRYLGKLARIDFDSSVSPLEGSPIGLLLGDIRSQLQPNWILLDARTGLSEPAGVLLSGLAHLHVLFGTSSEQSWQGMRVVLRRLGADRLDAGLGQSECLLVHAMVPRDSSVAPQAIQIFADRARDEFTDAFYAENRADGADESVWSVADAESEDAPHATIPLLYDPLLAHFRAVDEVAAHLVDSAGYRELCRRIDERFVVGADE